jgi:predicted trehalose synthase
MSNVKAIGDAFANLAAAFAERARQELPAMGAAKPPFPFFDAALEREAKRLRDMGQDQLADAVSALRSEIEGTDNG